MWTFAELNKLGNSKRNVYFVNYLKLSLLAKNKDGNI